MNPEALSQFKKFMIASTGFITLLILVVFWFKNGYVEIKVSGTDGQISYHLLNQGNQKVAEVKSGNKLKKRLSKGNYQIVITKDGKSSLLVAKVRGLLRKVRFETTLHSESARQFVGDRPKSCMYLFKETLYSYDCTGSVSEIVTHVPATAKRPTFVSKSDRFSDLVLSGLARTPAGLFALANLSSETEGSSASNNQYSLYKIRGSKLINGQKLSGLAADKNYSLKAYKNGFLVYDQDFKQILYYQSPGSRPQTIDVARPKDQGQNPYLLEVLDDQILIAYSNHSDYQPADDSGDIGKIKTTIALQRGNKSVLYPFDELFTSINLCGTNKLCLLKNRKEHSSRLVVYDIGGNKPKLNFNFDGVSRVIAGGRSLLVVQQNGVFNLDADKQSGYQEYSFGDYQYCGIQKEQNSFLLCISSPSGRNSVLRIDQTRSDVDNIDKKMLGLLAISQVEDASIYKNIIFINPELGEPIYNFQLKQFDFGSVAKKIAKQAIDSKISELNIDKRKFFITINNID